MHIWRLIMRTTIDINGDLISEVMKISGIKTKKKAVLVALREYLRYKKIEELKSLIGNYDSFDLNLDDLKKMRDER
jgi:Arc/MetJ family transcription regulator